MAELLWKRGTTLGQGSFGVVSLASTSNALFCGVTLPSLIALKSCNFTNVSFEDNVNLQNLLLEYAFGGSLVDCFRNCNSLPEVEVKKHMKNVLLGLSCIHNNGMIHCDIKPGNILLGTGRYMAPESMINTGYTPQVDIWALSCTVYELITGTPMWAGAYGDDVLNKIEFEEPKFQNSKLSNEAQDFLEKWFVKNPITCWTADMLLNHTFLQNSSKVANTRKKKSDSMSTQTNPEGLSSGRDQEKNKTFSSTMESVGMYASTISQQTSLSVTRSLAVFFDA
ncbi:hypothetical protein KY284_020091 [Solanum tuberosum]|nr:hypothetical protein KY284_020091 [Solanum tuberosum]